MFFYKVSPLLPRLISAINELCKFFQIPFLVALINWANQVTGFKKCEAKLDCE